LIKDWFAAGKGPNPDLVSLDKDIDDYFNNKNKEEKDGSAVKA
jgi:hypothetical protein